MKERWGRYQGKTFGVRFDSQSLGGIAKPVVWFRVSRKCASAVDRNRIRRIIRAFVRCTPSLFSRCMVFHVHCGHLNRSSNWLDYLKGLRNDLERWVVEVRQKTKRRDGQSGCFFA